MYTIEFYNIMVEQQAFMYLGTCTTFTNLNYENRLNEVGTCRFNLSIYDRFASKQFIKRFGNVVVVKKDGKIVWFGTIGSVSGNYADVEGTITVDCYTYLYYLKFRNTNKFVYFNNVPQQEIAWNLINATQNKENGFLGIVRGSYTTERDRDRTYENAEICQHLQYLTQVIDGFDFDFNPIVDNNGLFSGTTFDCYYPYKGTVRNDLGVLSNENGIVSLELSTESGLGNVAIVEGAGNGDVIRYEISDTDMQEKYTRIEAYEKASDVSEVDTLKAHASKLLQDKVERYAVSVEVMSEGAFTVNNLELGDVITINIDMGNYLQMKNTQARILSIPVAVDDNGVDKIKLGLQVYGN